MLLKSYDTILTEMCDSFDSLITPKTIARTTNNTLYLVFMAIAKGFEIIQNAAVVLSNKFNPASCSDEDLLSVANLVGTKLKSGSGSGLFINITNTDTINAVTLLAGTYVYSQSEDVKFYRTFPQDLSIGASQTVQQLFMTEEVGSFSVDSQPSITITRLDRSTVDANLRFSCTENSGLLGVAQETTLEFRKRILEGNNRQSLLGDLKATLDALPYVFETDFLLNASDSPLTIGGVEIPPYAMLFLYSGDPREEVATIIASSIIYPTVEVNPNLAMVYKNDLLAGGEYKIFYKEFSQRLYDLNIRVEYNPINVTSEEVSAAINAALSSLKNKLVTTPYITERDIYNLLEVVLLPTLNILSVVIMDGESPQPFLTAQKGEILSLSEVNIEENI